MVKAWRSIQNEYILEITKVIKWQVHDVVRKGVAREGIVGEDNNNN